MGGKARFVAPLDVLLLPIAAQGDAGKLVPALRAIDASGRGRCRPAVPDR